MQKFLKRYWFVLLWLGFLAYRFVSDEYIMHKYGVDTTVTVEYFERKYIGSNGAANNYKTVSCGYFYVNNRKYECHYRYELLPIGSVFKIRYNSKNPEVWVLVSD